MKKWSFLLIFILSWSLAAPHLAQASGFPGVFPPEEASVTVFSGEELDGSNQEENEEILPTDPGADPGEPQEPGDDEGVPDEDDVLNPEDPEETPPDDDVLNPEDPEETPPDDEEQNPDDPEETPPDDEEQNPDDPEETGPDPSDSEDEPDSNEEEAATPDEQLDETEEEEPAAAPDVEVQGYQRIIVPAEAYMYTAFDFYDQAQELAAAFPDLLKLEVLGNSADGRPVFVLIMAEGIRTRSYEEIYIQRYQLLMEAGSHSRETINSYLLMRTIEDYCLDFYDNQYDETMDIPYILKKGTFHFLILSNPDGYDAVKHGVSSIRNSTLRQNLINLLDGRSVSMLKAGIEGVDRNKNYADEYFNLSSRTWVNQFYTGNVDMPKAPAMENYPGPYPASCLETGMVQKYIARYPFRALLSYHSRGRVIYYMKEYLSATFNENVLRPFAEMAANVTGYSAIHYVSGDSAAGYLTHFTVNLLQKPALTVETTAESVYPIQEKYYEEEYVRVRRLPYRSMIYVIQKGFFPYRVYVGGKLFHDYQSEAYAKAVADKYKGQVITRVGEPVYEYIVVFTDGNKIPFSMDSGAPFIADGRTMLPVRRVAETLGAEVSWDQKLFQAEIYWDDQTIEIPINKDYIIVNGQTIQMDTNNLLAYNRTYVPLRFVFQSMGYDVSWVMVGGQHIIDIDSP